MKQKMKKIIVIIIVLAVLIFLCLVFFRNKEEDVVTEKEAYEEESVSDSLKKEDVVVNENPPEKIISEEVKLPEVKSKKDKREKDDKESKKSENEMTREKRKIKPKKGRGDDSGADKKSKKSSSRKSSHPRKEEENAEENKRTKRSFAEDFSQDYTLEETGKMTDSENENWWVNSGAFLYAQGGTGRTIFGGLPEDDPWLKKYKDYNAKETDDGRHPQNIFRLVLRPKWKNFRQECYYNIHKYILSGAKERSESNGILLFNRYLDGHNLYYTGLRVDGTVVVKKKYKGEYYTMAQKTFYPGKYHKKENPNLIPLNKWIGIRSEVETLSKKQVLIKVFVDENHNGQWRKIIEVKDDGKKFGGRAILKEGHAGIRTDFMDVKFDDYKISEL